MEERRSEGAGDGGTADRGGGGELRSVREARCSAESLSSHLLCKLVVQ